MRNLLLVLTLLFAWAVQADDLRYIQLHNRQASELISLLQPMLDPGDAITGSDYQLIVRTSSQRFVQIERMARQLDTEPQQLIISVRQNGSSGDNGDSYSASGNIGTGRVRIGVETPSRTAPGGSITTYQGGGSGTIRAYHYDSTQSGNLSQRITVLEGRWAAIKAGLVVPIQHQQGTEYADATSGFEVRPRLNGDEVILEIAPYHRTPSGTGGAIDTQAISTTVRGQLGEWLEIGGVDESGNGSESGIAYSGSSHSSNSQSVWLKVELAD